MADLTHHGTPPFGARGRLRKVVPVVPALAAEAAPARVRGVFPVDRDGPRTPHDAISDVVRPAPLETTVSSAPAVTEAPQGSPTEGSAKRGVAERGACERAHAAFSAFVGAFYVEVAGRGFFTLDRGSHRLTSFWTSAELIELVEDRFEGSGDPAARRMIDALLRGFVLRYGRGWTRHNAFNDDVMWAVLAALRAYRITGDPAYRDLARTNFDAAFARAWSGDLGGGLWWNTGRREKNACVNGPAAIVAGLLYESVRDPAYLATSRRLYAWLHEHLFEPTTGRVNDHLARGDGGGGYDGGGYGRGGSDAPSGVLDRRAFTYNQGAFIGAADLLYRHTGDAGFRDDALLALGFAAHELSPGGALPSEGARGDGGGFKGIFARHAVGFARRHGIAEYDDWFERNAKAAWERRDGQGLMDQDWAAPAHGARTTTGGPGARGPAAWDASSAVVLLLALAQCAS